MGAYLSGQDPYGQQSQYQPPDAPAGAPGGGAPLSPQEQSRYEQLVARARQLNAAGEPIPPADAAELAGFQQRAAPSPGTISPEGRYGLPPAGPYDGPMYEHGPIDQQGNPIGADQMRGITDPGFDPNAMRAKISGGDALAAKPAIPQAAYGSGGPDMRYASGVPSAGPTASVYGGPAVSATVGPQGYYAQPQPSSAASPYPSQDPRQKQAAALVKALPPSPYDGLNDQDAAALHGMEAIYKGGGQQIAGGEYERLKASGRLGFMQSAGKLLGYDPKELESQYQSYRPAQGSSRMAG
jgi:hypothetical protein